MPQTEIVQNIAADLIDDPQDAMRSDMSRDELWELAEDIKKNGLINPITIRPKGERFEVVAGARRLTACKMAAKLFIPCVVRDVDDTTAFAIMASENLKREDVNPVDEAEFVLKIQQRTGKGLDDIATMVGHGRKFIEDRLVVASMPDYMKGYLRTGQLKLGAALALVQIEEEPRRRDWVELAVRDGVSVRMAEYWLYQWRASLLPGATHAEQPDSDLPIAEYKPPHVKCAVDGKEYDIRDCGSVFVYKGNLPTLEEVRRQISAQEVETASATGR